MGSRQSSPSDHADEFNPKVLILSANRDNSIAMTKLLIERGVDQVTVLENGLQALKQLVDTPFEVILVDQQTKFIDGWAFIKEFKQSDLTPNTPILLFGSNDPLATLVELNEYGVHQYIRLPFRSSELEFLIKSSISLNKTSGTTENKYTKAKNALASHQTDDAISQFSELKSLTKGATRSSFGLAHAHVQNEDFESASTEMAEIVEKSGQNAAAAYFNVQLLIKSDKKIEAHQAALELVKIEPDNPYYYVKCAELFLGTKEISFVFDICELADSRKFETQEIDILRAKAHYLAGEVQVAVEITFEIEAKTGPSKETVNLRGICYRKLNNYSEAIECYEIALGLSPLDARLYFNIGLCWAAMGEYQSAIDSFSTAVKIAPNFQKAQDKIDALNSKLEDAS
jgi:tetratricopeptide (TPR) repeat protein